jgi:hypothetical protein
MLGWAYAMVGSTNEARPVLDEVTLDCTTRYDSPAQIGLIHFFLGEIRDGVRWLEEAYARENPQLRIPVKLATDSGDVGHPSERSDAGLF